MFDAPLAAAIPAKVVVFTVTANKFNYTYTIVNSNQFTIINTNKYTNSFTNPINFSI